MHNNNPASEVEDDMNKRAVFVHAKSFTEQSACEPFLQGIHKHGIVGTVVKVGGEEIDTHLFGSSRAQHRAHNTRLKDTVAINDESKMPFLFPFGPKESAADKRKRDGVRYLTTGNIITPQRTPFTTGLFLFSVTASATASSLKIDLYSGRAEEEVIALMVKCVRRCDFSKTGVVQEVIDVDTGETTVDEKAE